ncbi:MAG TPA: XdhC family protein [Trebonia sp.]|jgi:xanthine/CO dehydrogenase XdhC/CoxF family maturation factor|nr:XdhC family protein [Trebonia sp.]
MEGHASLQRPGPGPDEAPPGTPGDVAAGDSCAVAHGTAPAAGSSAAVLPSAGRSPAGGDRTLVAVFATPVAGYLLRYGADAGFAGILVEPDEARAAGARMAGFQVLAAVPGDLDDGADVVVTDHHREELGVALRDALAGQARWVGIMGNPHHAGPHVEALAALGVPPAEVARVHRPIGLNIGSRAPAEIAISTLAGLLADRNARPGGFAF